jgi:hypothetical protein
MRTALLKAKPRLPCKGDGACCHRSGRPGGSMVGLVGRVLRGDAFRLCCDAFRSLRTADDESAAHEFLVMEFRDRAHGFFYRGHGDKPESLRFFSVPVGDDFGVADDAHPVEEVEEVAFRGVEGQVAYIEFGRGDFHGLGLARGARCRCGGICTCRPALSRGAVVPRGVRTAAAVVGRVGFLLRAKAEKPKDLLKETGFLGGLLGAL